ncbi:hypothetical protein Vi05172_g3307 [Venturia inaequalis]|nr:hypothetical protein Vi05172_g3307 [Venturia inaequalis]
MLSSEGGIVKGVELFHLGKVLTIGKTLVTFNVAVSTI